MSQTYKMPIYFSELTYEIMHYGKRKGKTVLLDRKQTKSTREVHIGNTIEILNDRTYNDTTLSRLKRENAKSQGCEIKIVSLSTITQCGYTNSRFEYEE